MKNVKNNYKQTLDDKSMETTAALVARVWKETKENTERKQKPVVLRGHFAYKAPGDRRDPESLLTWGAGARRCWKSLTSPTLHTLLKRW